MSNFEKRFFISLLAFPFIYILLYQKTLFNILIVIIFLFCLYEWIKIFKKKNIFFFFWFINFVYFFNFINNNLQF